MSQVTDPNDPNFGLTEDDPDFVITDPSDPNFGLPRSAIGQSLQKAETIQETPWFARGGAIGGAYAGGTLAGPAGVIPGAIAGAATKYIPGAENVIPTPYEMSRLREDIGGTLGGMIPGPWGLGAAAAAGGYGAAQGEIERGLMTGQMPSPGDVAEAGGIGAARQLLLEGGGRAVAKPVTAVMSPGRGVVGATTEAAERLSDYAAREGMGIEVKLPAGAAAASDAPAAFEALAHRFPGGANVSENYTKTMRANTAIMDHMRKRLSKLADDPHAQGQVLETSFNAMKANAESVERAAFQKAKRGGDSLLHTNETVKAIDEMLVDANAAAKRGVKSPIAATLTEWKNGLVDGLDKGIPASELRSLQNVINSKVKWTSDETADKMLQRVALTLDDEFMSGLKTADPKLFKDLSDAKALSSELHRTFGGIIGQRIENFSRKGDYAGMIDSMVRAKKSPDVMRDAIKMLDNEGQAVLQTATVAQILAEASHPVGKTGEMLISPRGIDKAIKRMGRENLEVVLPPETMKLIDDMATVSRSLERGTSVMGGSQTAMLTNTSDAAKKLGVAVAGAATGNVFGLAPVLAGIVGANQSARFIGSEAGQRWLTTGLPLSRAVSGTVKMTPHALGAGYTDYQARQEQEQQYRQGMFKQ